MAEIQKVQTNMFNVDADAYVVPVPARVRNDINKTNFLDVTKDAFNRYKVSFERYKEISAEKEPYDNGEVYLVRDADFGSLDIEDPNVDVN